MSMPACPHPADPVRTTASAAVAPVLAWIVLSLGVGLPADPGALFGAGHLALSLEVGALFGLAALAARRGWRPGLPTLWGLTAAIVLVLLVRLADLSARAFAGRDFDPGYDLMLLPALWQVLTAGVPAPLLALGIAAGLTAAAMTVRWTLGIGFHGLARRSGRQVFALMVGMALVVQGAVLAGLSPRPALQPPDRLAGALVRDLGVRMAHAAELRRRSAEALARDPVSEIAPDALLTGLQGRDVVIVWVESYGVSALTDPRHGRVPARLDAMGAALSGAGFAMVSGVLESPVLGGRSWLAHGTFRAGIRQPEVPVQSLVLASGRRSLVHAFRDAGWRTVAAMPGLTSPWPEGVLWGFDRVARRPDLPYAGPMFGWSPMPDQALLAAVERLDLRGAGRPTYLEIVLSTSHGPWTPNPPFIDGADPTALLDGSAYDGRTGQPDYTRMAEGYAESIDYSLRSIADWLIRAVDDDALVIVLGDHPPVTWIAENRGRAVPMHVLSRDGEVLAPFRAWGFTDGLAPKTTEPLFGLEGLLERFLKAFSAKAPEVG